MRKLKEWVMETLLPLVIAFVIIGGVFSISSYMNYKENIEKNECIAQYDSRFQSISEEWNISKMCEEMICDELNLEHDGSGSWAKATIDCITKSGGRITIKMPQHVEGDCENYFWGRWEQAICLTKAGYLDDLT